MWTQNPIFIRPDANVHVLLLFFLDGGSYYCYCCCCYRSIFTVIWRFHNQFGCNCLGKSLLRNVHCWDLIDLIEFGELLVLVAN